MCNLMPHKLVEIVPFAWLCDDCQAQAETEEEPIPDKCPKCGGANIHHPPTVRGGPEQSGPEKKY